MFSDTAGAVIFLNFYDDAEAAFQNDEVFVRSNVRNDNEN
jgi:hypothetical protein